MLRGEVLEGSNKQQGSTNNISLNNPAPCVRPAHENARQPPWQFSPRWTRIRNGAANCSVRVDCGSFVCDASRGFRRLRHGGQQIVRVEHVHVNDGGQAVIGNVKKSDEGG